MPAGGAILGMAAPEGGAAAGEPSPAELRPAERIRCAPTDRYDTLGIRVVRDLP